MSLYLDKQEFIPILLGNDINSYSIARAFHEAYSVKSIIIGKLRSGPNNHSRISKLVVISDIEKSETFCKTMKTVVEKYGDKKLILIGCGDTYVNLIIENKNALLTSSFIIPYIDETLMNQLIKKEKFYGMCDKYNIDYPRTFILKKDTPEGYTLPFQFPVILKPSSGINYWKYPFVGQDKVFKLKNKEEFDAISKKIFDSGYSDSLIIQDFIPGDDSFMRVLTCYSDRNGKVKMMALGHVLLEEHTPHGLGNHAAILSDYDEPLIEKLKIFLEQIGYVGFSNFDIKYDSRDNKYKVFEINLRQGRSNFYVTGSGHNLARYIVEEYVRNKTLTIDIVKEKNLWLVIPRAVVLKYTKSEELKKEICELIKNNKVINPLFYKGDSDIRRMFYLIKSYFSHFVKYKKYYE